MARVVVIFAILALITGAMFWLARHPSIGSHTDAAVTTVPVAPAEKPAADAAPTHPDVPSPQDAASSGDEALPPAETNSAGIALNATGPEANVLQQQTTTTAQTGLVVENVEAGDNNSLSLKGRADPGATVKVSVNGKPAGEVIVGAGGAWSLSVDKGKGEAEPNIVLELVGADGKSLDKTNFVYKTVSVPPLAPQDQSLINQHTTTEPKAKPVKPPHGVHAAQEPAAKPVRPPHAMHAAQEPTAKPAKAHRVHAARTTFRVRDGESLWRIAKRKLGDGDKWRELYEANKDAIGDDPDFVRAGTRLVIPG